MGFLFRKCAFFNDDFNFEKIWTSIENTGLLQLNVLSCFFVFAFGGGEEVKLVAQGCVCEGIFGEHPKLFSN